VLLVFKGLVKFYAGRVVNRFQNLDLVEKKLGLFDVFLGYLFDSPPVLPSQLFSRLVNDSKGSFSKFLNLQMGYFWTKIVVLENVLPPALDKRLFVNQQIFALHLLCL
jgi:hypothetical protein